MIGPMECRRCQASLDAGDNFCRRCGYPSAEMRLPAVRPEVYPATRSQTLPLYVAAGALGAGVLATVLRQAAGPLVRRSLSRLLPGLRQPSERGSRRRAEQPVVEAEPQQPVVRAFVYRRLRIWRF